MRASYGHKVHTAYDIRLCKISEVEDKYAEICVGGKLRNYVVFNSLDIADDRLSSRHKDVFEIVRCDFKAPTKNEMWCNIKVSKATRFNLKVIC